MQKTTWTNESDVKRVWHIVDVKDEILGRASTQIAALLIGKNKVNKVPNVDGGDYVIVINSAKVKLTRGKESKKVYYSHTLYPGGLKEITFDKLMQKDPTASIKKAVERMLPTNKLKAGMMARLFVYEDVTHKHAGQNPKEYKLAESNYGK